MRWAAWIALVVLSPGCGSSDDTVAPADGGDAGGSSGSSGSSPPPGGPTDAGSPFDGAVPELPPPKCTPPIALADVTKPTTVVGKGTPASCTEAELRAAVTAGGVITFDCGAAEHTIVVTSPLAAPTNKDTTIDGGGKITLSGGDTTRIVELVHSFEKAAPTLTVQRITLTKGRTTDVPNTTATTKGGAAIYTLGGNVHAIEAKLVDNHGPLTGQDVAGGGIYSVGAGSVVVVRSVFAGNTCSNGGAVSVLGSNLSIVDTVLDANATTGQGGNPGNGGNGGASTMDGRGKTLTICGSTFTNNKARAFGGAVFRTSYENEATTIDKSVFDRNEVPVEPPSQSGAVYLQGTKVTMTNTSLTNNRARFAAAMSIYEHGGPAPGVIDMTNVTVANNTVWERDPFTDTGLVGGVQVGDRVTGTWLNVTLVGNKAQFASGIGGASTRLTIRNSIIANEWLNDYTPLNCNGASANGSDNLQWPATNKGNNDLACVTAIQRADPKMGPLSGTDMLTTTPQAGSPALGLGKSCPPTDQLGNPRKPEGCTAGAIEAP
ncbi:MAG: hypothetical protein KIT84_42820 [Labilithrix sp.]|nr:hypothetical protein [Labilithrix sp.]MCW5817812.1 hypothetical protein [Labilithrix sp.]